MFRCSELCLHGRCGAGGVVSAAVHDVASLKPWPPSDSCRRHSHSLDTLPEGTSHSFIPSTTTFVIFVITASVDRESHDDKTSKQTGKGICTSMRSTLSLLFKSTLTTVSCNAWFRGPPVTGHRVRIRRKTTKYIPRNNVCCLPNTWTLWGCS